MGAASVEPDDAQGREQRHRASHQLDQSLPQHREDNFKQQPAHADPRDPLQLRESLLSALAEQPAGRVSRLPRAGQRPRRSERRPEPVRVRRDFLRVLDQRDQGSGGAAEDAEGFGRPISLIELIELHLQ